MSLRCLLLTAIVLLLPAGFGLPASRGQVVSREERKAGQPEQPAPLRFRRVFAPADRMQQWPLGETKYVPVEAKEFERLISIEGSAGPTAHTSFAAQLVRASYHAQLIGDTLTGGRASLLIRHTVEEPALLSLHPCALAIRNAGWGGEHPANATLGLGVAGKLEVRVEHTGELPLEFDWSLAGNRDKTDTIHFQFRL